MPDALVELLAAHRVNQERERQHARQMWEEGGQVFTSAVGKPLIPQ